MAFLQSETADTSPYILNINSVQRDNFPVSSTTRFRIKLDYPLLYCNRVKMLTAIIPNTIIVFNQSNTQNYRVNTFIDFIDSSLTEKNAQIPTGTYDFPDFKAAVELAMNTASGLDTYVLTLDPATLKLTITSSDPNFSLLWLTGTNTLQNMYYEMGFNKVDTALAAVQTAVRPINLYGPPNLYIQSDQLKNVIHDSRNFTSTFQVSMDVPFGNIKYWKSNGEYDSSISINLKNITYLDVSLISDFGPVNLQNSDWGCLLEFRRDSN